MTDPNRPKWVFTSDAHLFHPLVAAERGFGTLENPDLDGHAEWWKGLYLEAVRPQDKVCFVGDMTGGGAEATEMMMEFIDPLPGEKHVVTGNHDETHPSNKRATSRQRRWLRVFHSVNPFLQLILGENDARRWVAVSHFPYFGDAPHAHKERMPEWRLKQTERWLLHGHTHDKMQHVHDGNQLHIGIDAWRSFVTEDTVLLTIANAEASRLILPAGVEV